MQSNVSIYLAFPKSLRRIIEDPTIIKAGVGIQGQCVNIDYTSIIHHHSTIGDADKLRQDFGVNLASCLELSYLARAVDHQWATTQGLISLARLVKAYEDIDFKKSRKVQMSNWELSLTDKQQDC